MSRAELSETAATGVQLRTVRVQRSGCAARAFSLSTSGDPRQLLAADLDGDGAPELIVVGDSDTTVHRNLTGPWR